MNKEECIELFKQKVKKYDESVEIKGVSVGEEIRILDTVLAYIEELEKKNKDLCENYCPKYKELENKLETQTQNYNSAYEDINWFCANYIPKQKIRNKIEELVKEADYRTEENPKGRIHFTPEPCDFQIQVLQELLNEEEK